MHDTGDYSYHIKEDGKIIGGIVASGLGNTMEIEFLFVEDAYRGKGIGRKLIEYVEDKAKENNMKRIILNTYSFQAPDFYKRLGYKEVFTLFPAFDSYSQSYFVKNL